MHFDSCGSLVWTTVFAGIMSVGCSPPARVQRADGGSDAYATVTSDGGDCAQGTEYVYTIDMFPAVLSQFDPATKTFQPLGTLQCPTTTAGATPNSMSVDRSARAWVNYTSGELFLVQLPGLECSKTSWSSPDDLK